MVTERLRHKEQKHTIKEKLPAAADSGRKVFVAEQQKRSENAIYAIKFRNQKKAICANKFFMILTTMHNAISPQFSTLYMTLSYSARCQFYWAQLNGECYRVIKQSNTLMMEHRK